MVICLERGADLHMVQRMPLPLTVSCFNKIQIGFTFVVLATFMVLAHPTAVPVKGTLDGCVYVCVCYLLTTRRAGHTHAPVAAGVELLVLAVVEVNVGHLLARLDEVRLVGRDVT